MDNSKALQKLTGELKRACDAGLVKYYHLGTVTSIDTTQIILDLYITLNPPLMLHEESLKHYLRDKYGDILRAIAVESNAW